MTIMEAIDARHSVRAYQDKPIDEETRRQLDAFLADCNQESGLNIFIRYDDPDGFDSRLAHYGSFRNVKLGLNTCWAALTFNKKKVKELIPAGETLCMVISLGYGETQGASRKSKSAQEVTEGSIDQPWFSKGIDAALKAPTAVNQQKFQFSLKDGEPLIRVKGLGAYTKVDLGIVAYHFEVASGKKVLH